MTSELERAAIAFVGNANSRVLFKALQHQVSETSREDDPGNPDSEPTDTP